MKIKRTSRFITLVVIVLSLIAIAFAAVARQYWIISQKNYEARRRMSAFSDQLAKGSDRLTNAVRAYAATGDKRYKKEFEEELNIDRNRDIAVAGLQKLGLTEEEQALIERAKRNSDKLVLLENQAFAAVENLDTPHAIQIVYGPEYITAKASIMEPIAQCRQLMEHRFTSTATNRADQARILDNVALSVLLVNAITIVSAMIFFYRRKVINPLANLTQNLTDLIGKKQGAKIGYQQETTEIGEVARSFEKYRINVEEADRLHWVKTNVAEIADSLQGAEQPEDFGKHLLSTLVPMVGGGVGAFHLFDENEKQFYFVSGYGFEDNRKEDKSFKPGQGIAGQAAVEKKVITLTDIPPNYIQIGSGLGKATPRILTAVPIATEDRVLAIVEVASFTPFTNEQRTLLEESAPMVALKLDVLQRNLRTLQLLEQVRVSEQRTRLILESTDEGIFGVDTDGRITFVNPAACELLGYTQNEMIGQPSHQLIHHHHPDGSEYPKENCPMFAAYKKGEAKRIDNEFLWKKDGSGLPVEYGATPVRKGEELVGAVISFKDITERKRAEAQLQHTNFLSDGALDLTKAGYWHVPLDGSGWYNSSERAALIFGDPPTPDHRYTLEHWAKHVREGDEAAAQITMQNFNDAIEGKVPVYDATYAYKRPVDDRIVWIHALGRVVKDANGKPTDMFGVTQDITDFKLLEMELVAAKIKADEATQMKSMFLANMSHEIRTPMNAIIGLSYLALKTSLNAKQRDYLNKIHNAGTSLLAVINDILDFSKIEAGKLDIEQTDFKLDDVITSVTTITGQKAHEKGLEFLADVPSTVPQFLVGDPLRLGQILTNLVNNAVKFTERGEIRMRAELVERTGEKCQLKFSVRDTGLGMTKEQAARLFQPFTQADMSTTRKHGGTGLGLTICRRLVELMGGQIWLESEPGQGSTFSFTVWLGIGDQKASGKIVPERLQNLNVLVVDDNAAACEIILDSLRNIVHQVDTVPSGTAAVDAIKRRDPDQPYDIVFMDWRMPGMDGLQASRIIKSDETVSHQPAIVMITAFGREEIREEAEHLHLDGFLLKPITKSMLVDTLVNIFAGTADETSVTGVETNKDAWRLQGVRVLLAEDNEINQQIAAELLEGVGAKVDVANHGGEAVEKLFQHDGQPPYDIVLMDLQMPEMDGYQATTKIRSDSRFANLPIIAMTAHATTEERQRCLDAGMNDHVSKPIDPSLLYETLSRFYKTAEATPVAVTQQSQIRPPVESEIPVVEGLDSKDGLTRVGGNQKLYLKLLRQFVDQQATAPQLIAEALASKDFSTAERYAHTMKGVAGNLGAREIQQVAASLEKSINSKAATKVLDDVLHKLEAVLSGFIARLKTALPKPESPKAAVSKVDPEELKNLLQEMMTNLNNFDPAAGELFDAKRDVFQAILPQAAFENFEKQISNFAFSDAIAVLQVVAKEKGVLL
jgi:PAS domain S-box-containing protein